MSRLFWPFQEKCFQYWPSDLEPHSYGNVQVTMRSESVLDTYAIRVFDVMVVSYRYPLAKDVCNVMDDNLPIVVNHDSELSEHRLCPFILITLAIMLCQAGVQCTPVTHPHII